MNVIDTHEKLVEAMKAQGGSCAAYACEMEDGGFIVDTGLTLRDHFAGLAMQAIIEADGIQYASNVTAHALFAYEQADAMLAERSKP